MSTPIETRRWRCLMGTGAVMVLSATLAWTAPIEPPQSGDPAGESEQASLPAALPSDAVDLTDKVEVTVNGKLRSTSATSHSVTFSVKNTSEEDLAGPLVVIVEQTGIDSLELDRTDGTLSDDRPYVEIVGKNGELKAGRTLRAKKLVFKTGAALSLDQRNAFEPSLLVCRYDEAAALAAKADEEDKIEGKSYGWKDYDKVVSIQEKWTSRLIANGEKQVYATGIGENDDGELVVQVFTERPDTDRLVPDTIDDIPVKIVPIGQPFRAGPSTNGLIYPNGRPREGAAGNEEDFVPVPDEGGNKASGTSNPLPVIVDPTVRFSRPVPIGVSIANADQLFFYEDFLNCYSGTLGCRCVDALGDQYILTNAHVGGALTVSLDDPIFLGGGIGDRIVQPSTGDAANFCEINEADVIGTLYDIGFLFFITDDFFFPAIYDVAVIQADAGAVGYLPPADGYQTLKRDIVDRPYLGMEVQKYGRTTVYTTGQVTGLNVIGLVGYDGGLVYFERMMTFANLTAFGQPFSQAGDSGSLIVQYKPGTPEDGRPVALLHAGGPTGAVDLTLGNPIGPILARFGLQIDDGSGAPYQAGVSGTMGGAVGPGADAPIFILPDEDDGGEITKQKR